MRGMGQSPMVLTLVSVYVLRMERCLSDLEYASMARLVSEKRRRRLGMFRDRADAERGLLGEMLARRAICVMSGILPGEQRFVRGEAGKPLLQNDAGVHFNVSHSGRYVVCAVDGSPVGIDVEEIAPVDLRIASRFFASGEKEYVQSAASGERAYRFFEVWTMKESYIKREGVGLSIPLPSFDVFEAIRHRKAFFEKVPQPGGAVCHVCTTNGEALDCTEVALEELAD